MNVLKMYEFAEKKTQKNFEPFSISRTIFDDEKKISFRKRVNGVKGGFNLHLSNQCRILCAVGRPSASICTYKHSKLT